VEKRYQTDIAELGLRVKRLREARGLSQQDLAAKIGVDIRTIQRIEKGQHAMGLQILLGLSDELETSVSELIGRA
jgi:transcriptional regulator with XRE-family HTH domain